MITAIVQARTGSTRLPGKIFLTLCDSPILEHVVRRLKKSKQLEQIVVATTIDPSDDVVEDWCHENDVLCFRGSVNNVLDRYNQAAIAFGASIIVRVTCDDPFKDVETIDEMVKLFLATRPDLLTNNNPPSFPEGLDVEIFTRTALRVAAKNAGSDFEKEHVTQHFYKNPSLFHSENYSRKENLSHLRLTVDTEEDFDLASSIYDGIYNDGEYFALSDILEFLAENKYLLEKNKGVKRSHMYLKEQT